MHTNKQVVTLSLLLHAIRLVGWLKHVLSFSPICNVTQCGCDHVTQSRMGCVQCSCNTHADRHEVNHLYTGLWVRVVSSPGGASGRGMGWGGPGCWKGTGGCNPYTGCILTEPVETASSFETLPLTCNTMVNANLRSVGF